MTWCVECGEAGKPEPATTTVDGDPLCAGHAKARGATVFNDEFLDRRMAEHKGQAPSAPKEQEMATCACGCGGQLKPDSPWNFLRGHKKAQKNGHDVPGAKSAGGKAVESKPLPGAQQAEHSLVDVVWNALPEAQKKAALRSLLHL